MKNQVEIICPPVFSLANGEHRQLSLKFLTEIENGFRKGKQLRLDFSQTEIAYAESTLALFALIHSIRLRSKNAQLELIYPAQGTLGYPFFISTRLAKALEAKTLEDINELTKTGNFYQSGIFDTRPEMLLSIWQDISREQISLEQKMLLHQAVGEAILNVSTHAYINKRTLQNKIGKGRWWQCSWFLQSKRQFIFLIYDMGSGILGTYTNAQEKPREEQLIEAMKEGNTRYTNQKRGRGSEDIKRAISNNIEEEVLTIYTHELIYQYRYQSNQEHEECLCDNGEYLLTGTLICWTLTLSEK